MGPQLIIYEPARTFGFLPGVPRCLIHLEIQVWLTAVTPLYPNNLRRCVIEHAGRAWVIRVRAIRGRVGVVWSIVRVGAVDEAVPQQPGLRTSACRNSLDTGLVLVTLPPPPVGLLAHRALPKSLPCDKLLGPPRSSLGAPVMVTASSRV